MIEQTFQCRACLDLFTLELDGSTRLGQAAYVDEARRLHHKCGGLLKPISFY